MHLIFASDKNVIVRRMRFPEYRQLTVDDRECMFLYKEFFKDS